MRLNLSIQQYYSSIAILAIIIEIGRSNTTTTNSTFASSSIHFTSTITTTTTTTVLVLPYGTWRRSQDNRLPIHVSFSSGYYYYYNYEYSRGNSKWCTELPCSLSSFPATFQSFPLDVPQEGTRIGETNTLVPPDQYNHRPDHTVVQ